jgi:hypothetical protein
MGLADEYLETVKDLASTATEVYGAVNGPAAPANANANARQAVAAPSPLMKYLPWGIGAVVLIVIVVLLRRK